MKEQIIQLEAHDDVVSVRDKLGWIRAPRVLLVWPEDVRTGILREKLDLILLQREATRRRAQLALVTRDRVVIEHAKDVGVAVFRSVKASHRKYWQTKRAEMAVSRDERVTELDENLVEAGTRLHAMDMSLPPSVRRVLTIVLFVITLLILLSGCYVVVPGASVWITPASNQVSAATTVTADPQAEFVDPANGVILARIVGVEVEGQTTIGTTGTELQPSRKARGIAVFSNLIPDQVTIAAGTVVRTSAGEPVRFVTLIDATLPGIVGEAAEIPIEAMEAGFTGNLPSSRVNQVEGPLSVRVAVTNPEPTAGGDASDVRAVSQEDIERVRVRLLQQLQQRAYAEMQSGLLDETEFIPIESLAVVLVVSETYTGYVGESRDEIGLAMRVTVQGVAVDERYARQIVYARLAEKVGSGYQIGPDSLAFRLGEVIEVDEQRRVTFLMQGAGDVSAAIDEADVKELLRGTVRNDAMAQLTEGLPLATQPRIEMWPEFWPFMPVLPLRINVVLEGQ